MLMGQRLEIMWKYHMCMFNTDELKWIWNPKVGPRKALLQAFSYSIACIFLAGFSSSLVLLSSDWQKHKAEQKFRLKGSKIPFILLSFCILGLCLTHKLRSLVFRYFSVIYLLFKIYTFKNINWYLLGSRQFQDQTIRHV